MTSNYLFINPKLEKLNFQIRFFQKLLKHADGEYGELSGEPGVGAGQGRGGKVRGVPAQVRPHLSCIL
jgi:hypothetical protein